MIKILLLASKNFCQLLSSSVYSFLKPFFQRIYLGIFSLKKQKNQISRLFWIHVKFFDLVIFKRNASLSMTFFRVLKPIHNNLANDLVLLSDIVPELTTQEYPSLAPFPMFRSTCSLDGVTYGAGVSKNKKESQKEALKAAFTKLTKVDAFDIYGPSRKDDLKRTFENMKFDSYTPDIIRTKEFYQIPMAELVAGFFGVDVSEFKSHPPAIVTENLWELKVELPSRGLIFKSFMRADKGESLEVMPLQKERKAIWDINEKFYKILHLRLQTRCETWWDVIQFCLYPESSGYNRKAVN